MKNHASHGGIIYKLVRTYHDGEKLPENREHISWCAIYANPKDNYADAKSCTLYRVPGVGIIAADVRGRTL